MTECLLRKYKIHGYDLYLQYMFMNEYLFEHTIIILFIIGRANRYACLADIMFSWDNKVAGHLLFLMFVVELPSVCYHLCVRQLVH